MIGNDEVIRKILERRAIISAIRSLLVGVSGIDGCGKGHLAAQLQARLAPTITRSTSPTTLTSCVAFAG